ncbi:heterokaryon incompatibility protein [Colletotrichum asianum]|uniref:Heterokaryon incompatibility protein n=1 Tax=Colletotrichum asianum TaxID=702518 RepID=A0A8H3W4D5_9PEZI|nr:heterokaryon incompatibility protein [Colletotrichum asianum]
MVKFLTLASVTTGIVAASSNGSPITPILDCGQNGQRPPVGSLEYLTAVHSIQHLLARYPVVIDGKDWSQIGSIFAANATASFPPPLGDLVGSDSITAAISRGLGMFASTHHSYGTQLIEVCSENTAVALTLNGTASFNSYPERCIGSYPHPNVNVSLARSHFEECRKFHNICAVQRSKVMPTRVIAVGDKSRSLRLLVTKGLEEPYLALYYCWGPSQTTLKLTKDTFDNMLKSIKEEVLTKTHQEAIHFTRALGLEYIWIDALCIIQGDEKDWAFESKRMEQVYCNSTLTIVAARSSDACLGFINPPKRDEQKTLKQELDRADSLPSDITPTLARDVEWVKSEFGEDVHESVIRTVLDRAVMTDDFQAYTNDGEIAPLIRPGFGKELWEMPDDDAAFPSAMQEWKAFTLTWGEIAILWFVEEITNKPDWYVKVFDEIVAKWEQEALAKLREKAKLFEATGLIPILDTSSAVIKSDSATTPEVKEALKQGVAALENIPENEKDWHPGSDSKVLDLVHPSLWPLVFGKSRIAAKKRILLKDSLAARGT